MAFSRILAIMVNWNGNAFLRHSIPTVLAELARLNGELCVVDNASTDGSVAFLHTYHPQVDILQTGENLGGAGGFSAGMRAALHQNCDYIWLLDNDIIVETGALQALIEVLLTHPEVGAAGSQICVAAKADTVQEVGGKITAGLGLVRQQHSGQPRLSAKTPAFQVDYVAACSVLIRRECLVQTGVFANFFIFLDDVEWCLRARKLGWQIWAAPASVIQHHYGLLKPTSAWREYYRRRNYLTVLNTYPPRYGRQLASFVYLAFLNYSLLLYHWRGQLPLYRSLLAARNDAINGRLGKRGLSFLEESKSPGILELPGLPEQATVFVDISHSIGDALAAMKVLNATHPKVQFYLPRRLEHYLDFLDLPNLHPAKIGLMYDAVVIGDVFQLTSLRRSREITRFMDGGFIAVKHPWRYGFIDMAKRFGALMLALVRSPWHWLKLLRTGKSTPKST